MSWKYPGEEVGQPGGHFLRQRWQPSLRVFSDGGPPG